MSQNKEVIEAAKKFLEEARTILNDMPNPDVSKYEYEAPREYANGRTHLTLGLPDGTILSIGIYGQKVKS